MMMMMMMTIIIIIITTSAVFSYLMEASGNCSFFLKMAEVRLLSLTTISNHNHFVKFNIVVQGLNLDLPSSFW
jgi:hypothetical protein